MLCARGKGVVSISRSSPSGGIVKLRLTAVFDAQHGGFETGWSPISWGSIDELFVNLTMPPLVLPPVPDSAFRLVLAVDSARLPCGHDVAPLDLHDGSGHRANASGGAEDDSCTNAISQPQAVM